MTSFLSGMGQWGPAGLVVFALAVGVFVMDNRLESSVGPQGTVTTQLTALNSDVRELLLAERSSTLETAVLRRTVEDHEARLRTLEQRLQVSP